MNDQDLGIPLKFTAETSGVEKALSQLSKKTRDAINAGNVNNSSIAKLSTQLAKAQLELVKTSKQLKSLEVPESKFVLLKNKIDTANQSISDTRQLIKSNNEELKNTESQYESIKQTVEQLKSKKNMIMQPYIDKDKIKTDLQNIRASIKEQMAQINEAIKITPKGDEQEVLIQKFNELNQELEETTSKLYSVSGSLGALTKTARPQIGEINAEMQRLTPELTELESRMNSSQGQVALLTQKLSEQEIQLKNYELELQKMESIGKDAFIPPEYKSEANLYIAKINELLLKIKNLEDEIAKLQGQSPTPDTDGIKRAGEDADKTKQAYVKTETSARRFMNTLKGLANSIESTGKAFARFTSKMISLPFKPVVKSISNLHNSIQGLQKMLARMTIRKIFNLALQAIIKFAKESIQELAKFSNSFNKSVSEMMSSFQYLGRNLVSAIAPIIEAITPIVTAFVDKITEAVIKVNAFFSALTGKKQMVVAKKQQYDYAKSLEATAEAAKDAVEQLGYYDKLNVIGKDKTENPVADTPSPFSYETLDAESAVSEFAKKIKEAWQKADFTEVATILTNKFTAVLTKFNTDIIPRINTFAIKLGSSIRTFIDGVFANEDMWTQLGIALGNIINVFNNFLYEISNINWSQIGKSIGIFISNAIKTIDAAKLATTLSNFVKGLLDMLISFFTNLDTKALGTAIGTFFANVDWWGIIKRVFQLIWVVIKTVFSTFITSLGTFFKESTTSSKVLFVIISSVIVKLLALKAAIKGISTALNIMKFVSELPKMLEGFTAGVKIIKTAFGGLTTFIKTVGGGLVKGVMVAAKGLLAFFTSPAGIITLIVVAIVGLVIVIVKNWDKIKEWGAKAKEKVGEWKDALVGKFKDLKEKITDTFKTIKDKVGNKLSEIKEGIKSKFRDIAAVVGEVICGKFKSIINAMIATAEKVLNKPVDLINSIISNVPMLSSHIGKLNRFSFPRLAQGAVIPPNKQFLAMLGDQKKGYNIETPLETMIEAFETALDNRKDNNGTSTIILQLDRREVARIVYDSMEKRYKQTGRFLKGVEV